MYHLSRFNSEGGKVDETQVEEWAEGYFHNLLTVFNSFFTVVEPKEAFSRMEKIPFTDIVAEELEGESEEIIKIAVEKTRELAEMELDFMRAYVEEA